MKPKVTGNISGYQGRDDTWNQCCIVHDTYGDDFHGKDGSRHRSTKKRGKSSAHATHDHGLFIGLIQM